MEYPDSENFCVECGSKLRKPPPERGHEGIKKELDKLASKLAAVERKSEERHESAASSSSEGLSKLTGKLGALEKRVHRQPPPARSEELESLAGAMKSIEKRIGALESAPRVAPRELESRIAALEKQVVRASKEALRVAKAKHMPDEEAMGMVTDLGELEQRVDELETKLGELPETEGIDADEARRKLGSFEKKLASMEKGKESFASLVRENEGVLNSLDARLQAFAKQSDLAELKKALSAENEELASGLAEMSGLKNSMEKSLLRIEKAAKASISSEASKAGRWMKEAGSRFATKEQIDDLLSDVDGRVWEKLKPVENLREKVMVIAGLALEQQEKFKELKSSTLSLVNRRLEQTENSLSKQIEQTNARADSSAAASSAAMEAAKVKMNSDVASLNESLSRAEEFENRLNGELEALKESAAFRHDIESLKELVESYNARLSTFKQMLSSHAKTIDEISQMKAQIESEQEQSLDEMNSRISEAVQEIRSQGNSIVADMEKKMSESLSAGMKSNDDTRARMDGEMRLVLDTLARSQGFDKAVESELAALKSDMARQDSKIRAAVADEKGALDNAISNELKKLQNVSKEAEHKFVVLKDSWDRMIKETVRKNADEFEKLRRVYSESLEKLNEADYSAKSVADKVMKDVERRMQEEGRANASLRKEMESGLKETKLTNRDSQEKLAMVKEFISNMESRLGADVESMERRVDRLSKIQQKQELDSLSSKKKPKER